MRALLKTPSDVAIFFVRIALGASLLPHGLAKLGLFDDPKVGFMDAIDKTATYFQSTFGFDPWMAYCVIAAEVLGSIALIFGFFGRFMALAVIAVMAGAAWKAGGIEAGEYLRWWIDKPGETTYGSYHILAIGAAVAIVIRGSGALSVDRALTKPV